MFYVRSTLSSSNCSSLLCNLPLLLSSLSLFLFCDTSAAPYISTISKYTYYFVRLYPSLYLAPSNYWCLFLIFHTWYLDICSGINWNASRSLLFSLSSASDAYAKFCFCLESLSINFLDIIPLALTSFCVCYVVFFLL